MEEQDALTTARLSLPVGSGPVNLSDFKNDDRVVLKEGETLHGAELLMAQHFPAGTVVTIVGQGKKENKLIVSYEGEKWLVDAENLRSQ